MNRLSIIAQINSWIKIAYIRIILGRIRIAFCILWPQENWIRLRKLIETKSHEREYPRKEAIWSVQIPIVLIFSITKNTFFIHKFLLIFIRYYFDTNEANWVNIEQLAEFFTQIFLLNSISHKFSQCSPVARMARRIKKWTQNTTRDSRDLTKPQDFFRFLIAFSLRCVSSSSHQHHHRDDRIFFITRFLWIWL